MKSVNDNAVGKYPHGYTNGQNTFVGVNKKLREFPILEGGSIYNGGPPGPYRAVTDYNNAFVGVMWETAVESKMTRCTPVADDDKKEDKKDSKKGSKTGKSTH